MKRNKTETRRWNVVSVRESKSDIKLGLCILIMPKKIKRIKAEILTMKQILCTNTSALIF